MSNVIGINPNAMTIPQVIEELSENANKFAGLWVITMDKETQKMTVKTCGTVRDCCMAAVLMQGYAIKCIGIS